ncbi:MAG: hypothetical protein KDC98_15615 [Planctomycetes bacterium]|nr:hypothetical protein [Planctomycetota bacterium]
MTETQRNDAEIEELCEILIGLDRERLRAALRRLEDRGAFTELQSRTLADAMRLALANDPAFADGMGTLIGKGVHATVQRDSAAFGRALAPAMGPAIRNAVRLMLQNFISSIEATVDQQLSLRSLRWRLEAWRTGRRFAEVVFHHTLLYRVDHVFLVHREGGIQLLHASAPGALSREPDLIAGMLTAIQDFVRDAFAAPSGDTLTSFAVGDLEVIVESGSHTALAAVVRGQPPVDLRLQLRESLDRIEETMGVQLAAFDGATAQFEAVLPYVEGCLLQSELPSARESARRRPRLLPWIAVAGAVAAMVWLVLAWTAAADTERRFAAFLAELREEPGIVVTDVEATDEGWIVNGLRDPLSRKPELLAARQSVGTLVQIVMRPYQALHEPFIIERVTRALRPPAGVELQLHGDRLTVEGVAGHRWLLRAEAIAEAMPGIGAVDTTSVIDDDERAWQHAAAELRTTPQPLATLQHGYGDEHRWLLDLVGELDLRGRALDQTSLLRCSIVTPPGYDPVTAAQTGRVAVVTLSRTIPLPLVFVGHTIDAEAKEQMLRFEAVARR